MPASRPWWCQDRHCTPDNNTPGATKDEHGASGWCSGRVGEPLEVTRGGQTHVNDGHFCFRSPVRGVVMMEVNAPDLELLARVALRGLVARDPDRQFNWGWFTGVRPNSAAPQQTEGAE